MRFLVVLLLTIIAAVIAEERTCEPGKPYKLWCNSCRCSPEGKPTGCTQMKCDRDVYNKDGTMKYFEHETDGTIGDEEMTHALREMKSCEPGKSFNLWCNTCKCSSEGKPAECTRMSCNRDVYNKNGTMKYFLYEKDQTVSAEEMRNALSDMKSCEPGKSFNLWCNTCKCSSEGKPAECTGLSCNRDAYNKDGTVKYFLYGMDRTIGTEEMRKALRDMKSCEPGKSFKLWCNTCECSPEGKPAGCTRMSCSPEVYNKDGTMIYNDAYEMDRSNEIDAIDDMTSCEPGKSFKLWCNTCKCSPKGKPTECTRKLCDRDVYNKDGTTNFYVYQDVKDGFDRKRREVEETRSCVPGKMFMRYCNACECSADGKSADCTKIECNLDYWNEDGTLTAAAYELDSNDLDYDYRKKRAAGKPVVCPRGKVQWRYCNACTCSADGTELKCTKNRCASGEFDKNGKRAYQHLDLHY